MQTILCHERTPHGHSEHHRTGDRIAGRCARKGPGLLADPKAAIEELTGQTLGEGDIAEIVSGVKDKIAGGDLDLGSIAEGLDLGAITENLGGVLENTPLGGIAEGLGGLFGKK